MRKQLEDQYNALMQYFNIDKGVVKNTINKIIKESLHEFVSNCNIPAIWCYGKHTKMLMADFIFEMKGIRFIIDEAYSGNKDSGFIMIDQSQIRECGIDGIIISSFKYREEIKAILRSKFSGVKYLDLYDVLENNEIFLVKEYYESIHPYGRYMLINEYSRKLQSNISDMEKDKIYSKLVREYVGIKDFRNAIIFEEARSRQCGIKSEIIGRLRGIYEQLQSAAAKISGKNVLMLCIDGLRRQDALGGQMKKIKQWLEDNTFVFLNAYSVSTSTYESLIPAYSGNMDLRTRYFESNIVGEEQCDFIQTAIEQGRKIHFYTDSCAYIDSKKIVVTDCAQTATEKLWDFILDSVEEENGLYYMHILYESHYSYANPYTETKLIADGSSIMFDFLSRNGEMLRADYDIQHRDALRYLDDVLYPLLVQMKIRLALFADHGNMILKQNTRLSDITYIQNTFHEDLIRIPLVVKSPEMGVGCHKSIISLMEMNNIIISLLKRRKYVPEEQDFIKIVRSEIYNPDFRYLYKKIKHERGLMAFEGFIFQTGYKLIVYPDGKSVLYETEHEQIIDDDHLKNKLLDKVRDFVTVTDMPA
ncbi:hypothetical protein D7X88_17180 [bacterium C-53]|nr:hypothetical protein [Lachnospiraceae bacterium]NBI04687.1 hypothetical protein [Lachnospiraceae bacterium]RKJ07909.1 hypothetical protein D7X88_17180 [bacterium C-53]